MRLLIVVDKLLTGFDAPPATYLYIDKKCRIAACSRPICPVNRLDGDDKDYGYIVNYRDLFNSLEKAVADYTGGTFDGYDRDDENLALSQLPPNCLTYVALHGGGSLVGAKLQC